MLVIKKCYIFKLIMIRKKLFCFIICSTLTFFIVNAFLKLFLRKKGACDDGQHGWWWMQFQCKSTTGSGRRWNVRRFLKKHLNILKYFLSEIATQRPIAGGKRKKLPFSGGGFSVNGSTCPTVTRKQFQTPIPAGQRETLEPSKL